MREHMKLKNRKIMRNTKVEIPMRVNIKHSAYEKHRCLNSIDDK
jgi:hypothetical protein